MFSRRMYAGFIDLLITATIMAVLMFLFVFRPIYIAQNDEFSQQYINAIFGKVLVLTIIAMSYMVFRDIIGKKSVGKVIFNLRITAIDGQEASTKQRFIRNITWLLGPVELISLQFFDIRIGDKIAKTKVLSELSGIVL